MTADQIERAIVDAAARVLQRRAAGLRERAAKKTSGTTDRDDRTVLIVDPQARIAIGTAELLDQLAVDIGGPPLTAIGAEGAR